jgi:hypothetical protein
MIIQGFLGEIYDIVPAPDMEEVAVLITGKRVVTINEESHDYSNNGVIIPNNVVNDFFIPINE